MRKDPLGKKKPKTKAVFKKCSLKETTSNASSCENIERKLNNVTVEISDKRHQLFQVYKNEAFFSFLKLH